MIPFIFCTIPVLAKTLDVRVRIDNHYRDEETITRENLVRIQQFILKLGHRETYGSFFSNNPAYKTKDFRFYLNPDTAKNLYCDSEKSEFHTLLIQRIGGGNGQSRIVEFLDRRHVYISTNSPSDEMTVRQIRQFVIDAMKELLAEMDKLEPSKPDADDNK